MTNNNDPVTPEELAAQGAELLPDREAMSILNPLPPQPAPDDILYPVDPVHPGADTTNR